MLTEISACRNFMDIKKGVKLLSLIKKNPSTLLEIKKYFSNDIIILGNLEDTITLYKELGILKIHEDIIVLVDSEWTIDIENFISKILKIIIKEKIIIFSNIDNEYFFRIAHTLYALRNLLLSENIISNYHIRNLYLVNQDYVKYIKIFAKRKVSKKQLLENLVKQDEYGERAELFVIDFEKKALNNKFPIVHVALEDSGAGFDIKSYISEESSLHDKFIEVKCYSPQTKHFFISRNEIETAKKLNDNYFLYLVESSFTNSPIIITNPYRNIVNNPDINRLVESYKFDISEILSALESKKNE